MRQEWQMADFPRNNSPTARDSARRKAMNHFAASEQRDSAIRTEIARERDAVGAKTAKLKALRLAKEEADRIEAANAPPPPPKKPRAKIVKS
jgi:hypothetical protein